MADERGAGGLRWAGVTEPTTVLTDLTLAAVAVALGGRLGYAAAADGRAAALGIAAGLLATSLAAMLAACAHATDPAAAPGRRALFWRASLHLTGVVAAATLVAVAFFASRGTMRAGVVAVAALKLAAYTFVVARRPEFRIAVADYGSALSILFAAAVAGAVAWRAPGTGWLMAGVAVSLVGSVAQASRVRLHRYINHNDLFHLIQMVALYLFYRGGSLLVDR